MKSLWVLGAGGHAKVVIDAVRASDAYDLKGVIDDRAAIGASTFQDLPLCGPINPETIDAEGVTCAIIAIGDNRVREAIAARIGHLVEWAVVRHPSAIVAPSAGVSEGAFLAAGAIVQPDAVIGAHSIVNTRASVDHDSLVGAWSHVAPAACLAGNVHLGEGVFVGAGAAIIPGMSVGEWSTIGAGAAVVDDIPANVTAVGVPAKVINRRHPGPQEG